MPICMICKQCAWKSCQCKSGMIFDQFSILRSWWLQFVSHCGGSSRAAVGLEIEKWAPRCWTRHISLSCAELQLSRVLSRRVSVVTRLELWALCLGPPGVPLVAPTSCASIIIFYVFHDGKMVRKHWLLSSFLPLKISDSLIPSPVHCFT